MTQIAVTDPDCGDSALNPLS